ncbi:MAG: tetratricopeptide repeat protein [Nocardioidaceae bacterium]
MRRPSDSSEFTDQVLELLRRSGPAGVIRFCQELLDGEQLPEGVSRADLLTEIGQYSEIAGYADAAVVAYQDAIAEGRPWFSDPRQYLASWHFEHGDLSEGQRFLDEIWSERPRSPRVCHYVGELHEHRGDLAAAIRWLTAGALTAMRDDDAAPVEAALLLIARRRVRLAQGFTDDDYDEMAVELGELFQRRTG